MCIGKFAGRHVFFAGYAAGTAVPFSARLSGKTGFFVDICIQRCDTAAFVLAV